MSRLREITPTKSPLIAMGEGLNHISGIRSERRRLGIIVQQVSQSRLAI